MRQSILKLINIAKNLYFLQVFATILFLLVAGAFIRIQRTEVRINPTFIKEKDHSEMALVFLPEYINISNSITQETVPYPEAIAKIRQLRAKLKVGFEQDLVSIDSVKNAFTINLVNTLIPYWYGTKWSFGGHTAVPNKGEVACGYFVSTTMRDMGLNLNRYKLAQKSPIDEAKVISCGNKIIMVEDIDNEQAILKINQITLEGLYFIGYDTGHVGYLLKENGSLFLIHSNYLYPFSVSIEPLEDSMVFRNFSKFYLVDITHNEQLLKNWLYNRVLLK